MLLRRSTFALALALLAGPQVEAARATFPGRNGEIVSMRVFAKGGDLSYTMMKFDPRSHSTREVYFCGHTTPPWQPWWCDAAGPAAASPSGRRVAVPTREWGDSGTWGVRVADPDKGSDSYRTVPLDQTSGCGWEARWSPHGGSLLVTRSLVECGGPYGLFTVRQDGTDEKQVGVADSPSVDWSSTGRLAFIRGRDLYIAKPGGRARRLTRRGAAEPSWSPHGGWIAFSRDGDVWAVRARGGRARKVTPLGGTSPAWSPDGKQIAFYREEEEFPGAVGTFLYTVNWRTRHMRRTTSEPLWEASDPWEALRPDWSVRR